MIRSKRLDDAGVENLKPGSKRVTLADPELRGHYIRVTPNGAKSFWVVARHPNGKQVWRRLGDAGVLKIDDARKKAMATIRAIRATIADDLANSTSFESVVSLWLERHVEKNKFRSQSTPRGLLKNHILPAFRGMNFVDVRRKHVIALLDRVEDKSGARSADYVLSILTTLCNWYAMRDEDYSSPIVRGMGRQKKKGRDRILNDREIAALWATGGLFGNFTKFALLTAQRKETIAILG